LLRIVSGGQNGVDRGALDAALDLGVECGGWCPAGRLAEDGIIPQRYPVIDLKDSGYAERTAQNVADSDGTLIILNGEPMGGTRETIERCIKKGKPYLIINYREMSTGQAKGNALKFLQNRNIRCLNVAGPRASQWPEGHAFTYQIVSAILRRISGQKDAN